MLRLRTFSKLCYGDHFIKTRSPESFISNGIFEIQLTPYYKALLLNVDSYSSGQAFVYGNDMFPVIFIEASRHLTPPGAI